MLDKKVKAHTRQRPKWPELIPVLLAGKMPRSIVTSPPLDGMLVYLRVTLQKYVNGTQIHLGKETQSGVKFPV